MMNFIRKHTLLFIVLMFTVTLGLSVYVNKPVTYQFTPKDLAPLQVVNGNTLQGLDVENKRIKARMSCVQIGWDRMNALAPSDRSEYAKQVAAACGLDISIGVQE